MKQIEQLIEEELQRALAEHGPAHSSHEAWALLHEEAEETAEEADLLQASDSNLWYAVRGNKLDAQRYYVEKILKISQKVISEAIQAAAMARKFEQYLERGETK